MHLKNLFQIIGLSIDILGALFLAKSFMFKSIEKMKIEAKSIYGSNPHFIKSMIFQKTEAYFGFILLFIGFSFQILGILFQGPLQKVNKIIKMNFYFIILFVLLLLIIGLCSWFGSKKISRHKFIVLMKNVYEKLILEENSSYIKELDKKKLLFIGENFFYIKINKKESLNEYRKRLTNFILKKNR